MAEAEIGVGQDRGRTGEVGFDLVAHTARHAALGAQTRTAHFAAEAVVATRRIRRVVHAGIDVDAAAELELPATLAFDLRCALPRDLHRRCLVGGSLCRNRGLGRSLRYLVRRLRLGLRGGQLGLKRIDPLRHRLHLGAHGGQLFLNRCGIGGTCLSRECPPGGNRQCHSRNTKRFPHFFGSSMNLRLHFADARMTALLRLNDTPPAVRST